MAQTSKPISTISYNTHKFLVKVLNELLEDGHIGFWAIVFHKKEDDELADHFHVYAEPEEKIDTISLKKLFLEPDFIVGLPRACKRWQKSDWSNWYLYGIHDPDYLESKKQSRKYHYIMDNVECSDRTEMLEKIHNIDYTRFTSLGSAIRAAKSGETLDHYLERVPVKMVHFRSLVDPREVKRV